jgi:hypothetical protein
MAQADQTVENATFPTVRAEINSNLAALFSASSGNTEPSVTVAFQDWINTNDPDNKVWYKRNAANNAWITVATITGSAVAFEGTLPSQTGNAGEYLTTDGTVASWGVITEAGQLLRAPQVLTSGTSYTAPANCTAIYVEAVGGGGGGGGTGKNGAAPGGGAGGYCARYFTVVAGVSYTYGVGAGGAAGLGTNSITGGAGGAGGSTTFTVGGTTITSNGGAGGDGEVAGAGKGGDGGLSTNGEINVRGGPGSDTTSADYSGGGGNSFYGGGAPSVRRSATGSAGQGGGGGSGGATSNTNTGVNGGAGGAGLIRIWEFS